MFETDPAPRLYGLAPGVDFPRALVEGLRARLGDAPPEALARVQIIVNTRRMARRLRDIFDEGPPALLPRLSLVTDLGESWQAGRLPPAAPRLRRQLELAQLVAALLDRAPDIAPRSAVFGLADSLAALIDEMHGEGVAPDTIAALDITDQSGHWARIKRFLEILRPLFDADAAAPDPEARQRRVIEALTAAWVTHPPGHPVIVAGSTGSRGATHLLMQAVARLPQGAVVLPGFDFDAPAHAWDALADPLTAEDHPQYRFARLAQAAGVAPGAIRPWQDAPPPCPARNRLVSLALRPAPVTDQWLRDGPALRDIPGATADITLLEAPDTRSEALAIALRLRAAAEEGTTAALITPDRNLTRQVTAALDRWRILPDDSAGQPLHLSPPGRFLRHAADLFADRTGADALLALLKHPLTHSGAGRGTHLRLTGLLEHHLRRHGPPYPEAESLRAWAAARQEDEPAIAAWIDWLCTCLIGRDRRGPDPLATLVTAHRALTERIARGAQAPEGAGTLWDKAAGEEARKAMDELAAEADAGGEGGTPPGSEDAEAPGEGRAGVPEAPDEDGSGAAQGEGQAPEEAGLTEGEDGSGGAGAGSGADERAGPSSGSDGAGVSPSADADAEPLPGEPGGPARRLPGERDGGPVPVVGSVRGSGTAPDALPEGRAATPSEARSAERAAEEQGLPGAYREIIRRYFR